MNYGFVIDNRKCIGCHACTVACKAEHQVPVGVNRTWVKYVETGVFPHTRRTFTVQRCNHCADAPCVEICPVRALFIRPDGIVDFDGQRCIGCKSCMQACPYDALYIDPDTQTAAKCNYCAHRVDNGIEPACVVVCPERAIIAGDLDDPGTEIARLVARHPVSVRKAEKGTRPKLFYIDADEAALRPELAPPGSAYSATAQAAGVGHHAHQRSARWSGAAGKAAAKAAAGGVVAAVPGPPSQRTYDVPDKGVLWGWEVAGYLWTKSIAAGVVTAPLLLDLAGIMTIPPSFAALLGWLALLFLALTGVLLVKDLDRPARFLYVLLRPQWRSWLVRGAYAMLVYGGLCLFWALYAARTGDTGPAWFKALLAIVGLIVASYTGFLFAQAKGRDFWQTPLLPIHMALQSVINGLVVVLGIALLAGAQESAGFDRLLAALLLVSLGLLLTEFMLTHASRDAATAAWIIIRGPLRRVFWPAAALGIAVPLVLFASGAAPHWKLLACVLVLIFSLPMEHVRVKAPQLVPQS